VVRWGSLRSAAVGFSLLAVVSVGYAVGQLLRDDDCSLVVKLACLVGIVFALVALTRLPLREDWTVEPIVAAGLLDYLVQASASHQFAWVGGTHGVVVAVAWLSPLVVGGVILPSRGYWFAGLGCWAVLFAGTAALSYSASHFTSGVGLFFAWRS
jgi:hypothetical protein